MLDAAKVADIIVPVVCPGSDNGLGVDESGEEWLNLIKSQGLPSCLIITQDLSISSSLPKKTCSRYLHTLLPDKPKITPLEKVALFVFFFSHSFFYVFPLFPFLSTPLSAVRCNTAFEKYGDKSDRMAQSTPVFPD